MSIFENAPAAPAPKGSKTSKADSRKVHEVEGLSELAAVRAMIGTLEGLEARYEAQVKGAALNIFTDEAIRYGKRPETFNMADFMATGQGQLRERSTASPIDEAQRDLLTALSLPTELKVKREGGFIFNPDLTQAQLEAISKAVTKEKTLAGVQVVLRREEESVIIVSKGAIEAACAKIKDKAQLQAVFGMIAVQSVKTAFDSPEMKDALTVLEKDGVKLLPDAVPAPKGKKKTA